nr:ABC transporter substrate-binding protein [Pelistega indica]
MADSPSIEVIYTRIKQISQLLNASEQGEELINKVKQDILSAQALPGKALKTVLLINRTGALMAAGKHTAADEIMKSAGVENIFAHQQGYKPVSAENLANIEPELIIVTEFSAKASGGIEKIKSHPAIINSPAAKNNRIIILDDLLAMGLGPRTGEAIRQIKTATNL